MFPRFFCCLCALLAASRLGADDSLVEARYARFLLGPEVWSEVVHLETDARTSPYGPSSYALVFEFSEVLWFYSPRDGTQSLSLHQGRAELDRADLDHLLREIDPQLVRWRIEPAGSSRALELGGKLRNGCFVESLVALRGRLEAGRETGAPQLFAFYRPSLTGQKGHTVLVFERGEKLAVIDPDAPSQVQFFPRAMVDRPIELAKALGSRRTTGTRWLPLTVPLGWMRGAAIGESTARPPRGDAGPSGAGLKPVRRG